VSNCWRITCSSSSFAIIYKYQSGFLPKHSTIHQLLELCNSILNSLEKKEKKKEKDQSLVDFSLWFDSMGARSEHANHHTYVVNYVFVTSSWPYPILTASGILFWKHWVLLHSSPIYINTVNYFRGSHFSWFAHKRQNLELLNLWMWNFQVNKILKYQAITFYL
jgi:hypothetical protein